MILDNSTSPKIFRQKVYMKTEIKNLAMNMPRVDTHCHLVLEENNSFPDLKTIAKELDDFAVKGNMVESRIISLGCKKMYEIDVGIFFRENSPGKCFRKAKELRAEGTKKALEKTFEADNISNQLCFSDFFPQNCSLTKLSPKIKLLAFIDDAVAGNFFAFCPDHSDMEFNYFESICEHFGKLASLSDYLDALDSCIDNWRKFGVVGMKTAFAYTLGLEFIDPTLEEAKSAFAKRTDMSPSEIKIVQHYAFRHALLACLRNELPVVIHTGFQIWGHADLRQSNPMLLHNLLIDKRYKDLTFVLLHGGNPYVGETTYLARMFPNVIIDFTWISWMTRARFRLALAEWIEIVPHAKFCWGSDSNFPENIVGIGQIVREEIGIVLEDLIERKIIDEETAIQFLEHTYQKTPKRVFNL